MYEDYFNFLRFRLDSINIGEDGQILYRFSDGMLQRAMLFEPTR